MPAKKRKGAAMGFDFGHDLAGQIEEVVLKEADDMEAIRHDPRIGEPAPSQGPVRAGEVHADHPHLLTAFESGKEPAQLGLAAPRDDVKNTVIAEIAKCCGERHSSMDTMFVDSEDAGTLQTLPFAGLARGKLRINPSHTGAPKIVYTSQRRSADPFVVISVNTFRPWLGALPPRS